jgi:hypothetical protein
MDSNDIRKVTSLLDLAKEKPKTVELHVEYNDDTIALDVELLSNYDWMQLDHEVPYPERVRDGVTAQGTRYDYNHPDYQRGLRERVTRVQLKCMARCIQATIPGETNDEQANWLHENYSLGFLSAIAVKLNELHTEGEATIVHRSKTFLGDAIASVAHNGAVKSNA